MRWELLFADLEGRLEAAERATLDAEIAERTHDERAAVSLAARLAGARGAEVALVLRGGRRVVGTVADAAGSWVLLRDGATEVVVPLAAVAAAEALPHRAAALGVVEGRLRVTTALRELAEAGGEVLVETDGGAWAGVVAAVGSDHLDLDGPGGRRAIALASLLAVRSRP